MAILHEHVEELVRELREQFDKLEEEVEEEPEKIRAGLFSTIARLETAVQALENLVWESSDAGF
jgi:sugar-specific transcriptional regulator TrmB